MSLTTTLRNYITLAELQTLAGIVITNNGEALRQIERAEQAIDDYVGYHCPSVDVDFRGTISAASGKQVFDTNPASQLHILDGYFEHCVIEILGGTGAGQIRYISGSSFDNRSVTIVDDWDTLPDTTSFYRIYQLAKFPRQQEVYTRADGRRYYKAIPDAIKRAVAAQIEFMIAQGDAFFVGNQADVTSESIGNYSYSKANGGQSPTVSALAPRARTLLRGYKNSMGTLHAENPTSL
jgi:hypothetical protein